MSYSMCTIYTWTCAVLTGAFAVPPAAALTAVPALDADLETGLEVLITWASLSRLNLSSSIWRTFRCSSSRVCGWWWWWLSTSESSPSPELERLALENKKHIQNTAWESNKNLAGIIYLNLLGMARKYSMVPDCAHGQNKNIMGKICKTTTWIKTTRQGLESKNDTPYKNLTGHYMKNAVQIKTTGVWLTSKHVSQ